MCLLAGIARIVPSVPLCNVAVEPQGIRGSTARSMDRSSIPRARCAAFTCTEFRGTVVACRETLCMSGSSGVCPAGERTWPRSGSRTPFVRLIYKLASQAVFIVVDESCPLSGTADRFHETIQDYSGNLCVEIREIFCKGKLKEKRDDLMYFC